MHVIRAIAVAVGLVLAACGGSDDSNSNDGSSSSSSSSGGDGSSSSSSSTSSTSSTSSSSSSGSSTFGGQVQQGQITFYVEADGSGACGFDKTPNDLDVGAFNNDDYAASATCGGCVAIKGPKGNVTVRIVDRCPGCSKHGIDLSPSAFEKVADKVQGRVSVTWQAVACNVTGNIKYHFQEGSSKFYTAIQLRNHKVPIAKLEYKDASGNYVAIDRKTYNYFVVQKGVGNQPNGLFLRVTSADGQVLEDKLSGTITPDSTVDGAAQFK